MCLDHVSLEDKVTPKYFSSLICLDHVSLEDKVTPKYFTDSLGRVWMAAKALPLINIYVTIDPWGLKFQSKHLSPLLSPESSPQSSPESSIQVLNCPAVPSPLVMKTAVDVKQ